jgi:hypothetical protein
VDALAGKFKFGILGAGILGVIATVALPVAKIVPMTMMSAGGHGILVLVGFLVPAVLAGLGAFMWKSLPRWAAGACIPAFGLTVLKCREGFSPIAGSGMMLALVAGALGIALAIAAIVKPEAPAAAKSEAPAPPAPTPPTA